MAVIFERECNNAAELLKALEDAKAAGVDLSVVDVHLGGGQIGSVDFEKRELSDGSTVTNLNLWIAPC